MKPKKTRILRGLAIGFVSQSALGAIREILLFLRRCCRQRFRKESEVRGVPITLAGLVGKWVKFSSGGVSELCEGTLM